MAVRRTGGTDRGRRVASIARTIARSGRRRWRDLWYRLEGRPVPPWRLRATVPGDFWLVGQEFREYLVTLGGLRPEERVLEIGARAGRMAIPLTRYLGSDGSYEGVDDSAEGTAWCARAISGRYPNFTFSRVAHVDMAKGRLPYEDGTFDFVLFGSIAGLTPEIFSRYVTEGARILRSGGTYFGTWYLVCGDRVLPDHPPLSSTEAGARDRFEAVGLTVEAVHRGSWDGHDPALSFQDVVIARKR